MLTVWDKPATNRYKPNHCLRGWFSVSAPFIDGRNISSSSSKGEGNLVSQAVIFHLLLSLRLRKLLVLVWNSIYFNLTKKHMASVALLLLLMHSCCKEGPLAGDLLSIMVHGSSLFRQSFSILKVIPQPRVSKANLVGDFSPTHHLSPQEKGAQEGEPGLWLL